MGNTSEWKTKNPATDIGTLRYPHTVKASNGETLGELASFEDAEALLARLVTIYVTVDLMPTFREMGAERKLRHAVQVTREADAKEARKNARREERFTTKREDRERMLSERLSVETTEWLETKTADAKRLARSLATMSKELSDTTRDMEINDDVYDTIARVTSTLSILIGNLKNHHFGVTSSRHFSAIVKARRKVLENNHQL